ncbi:glycosyltransferase involved in cell wall biosynthesis [Mesoflavibacter sabulilitoris]|uniref:Glycosyl transferase family 2 n=1 Tax=Mesoflavibacter zeaxanthinifaciens subsp. sabulilitoris TaxID=1520893 RepID=A0A2T1NH77_9FLAO|nr:glycosyltransferase [Mesoflavibacter zeaxanthinifaciens]MBB3122708.1 glycosyltransferase involved in cell wall biosynthesis [Mesoflavibacter zeaxanthinifaciens subsp. sabulilitoris]PSG92204.1 glycosyl transferase family 2 [Mesoflavibacter zeaxanthinifaciens subsp. sabulilitoris]
MKLDFSFIIPVYNRPNEIEELLQSFSKLKGDIPFEVVIIEDGSTLTSKAVISKYQSVLDISYFFKPNSGPGDSRNYGMKKAKGNYFIILDSDCLLPSNYLIEVKKSLVKEYVDCFGGPDAAHKSFTSLQKAIDFSMTSVITTGGIRGNKKSIDKFQPRSFNMGLSKKGFLDTNGFGNIHPGEDPDLSIRLWNLGYKTKLIPEAFVYHKRRISWSKFYKQVYKFGSVRPILNLWHPSTKKITYWFPSVFIIGLLFSIVLAISNVYLPILAYVLYFSVAFILAILKTKNLMVAIKSVLAIIIQFFGYGYGFLKSTIILSLSSKKPENLFPSLFFKR